MNEKMGGGGGWRWWWRGNRKLYKLFVGFVDSIFVFSSTIAKKKSRLPLLFFLCVLFVWGAKVVYYPKHRLTKNDDKKMMCNPQAGIIYRLNGWRPVFR